MFVGGTQQNEDSLFQTILKSHIMTHGVVRHLIDSFDAYTEHLLPMIVQENSTITVAGMTDGVEDGSEHKIEFTGITIPPASAKEDSGFVAAVTPAEAIWRNTTYSSSVLTDVLHTHTAADKTIITKKKYREIPLFKQPIMVKSAKCHSTQSAVKEMCPSDPGGYFVINGIEKFVIPQQRLKTNYVFVFPGKHPDNFYAEIRSCHEEKTTFNVNPKNQSDTFQKHGGAGCDGGCSFSGS